MLVVDRAVGLVEGAHVVLEDLHQLGQAVGHRRVDRDVVGGAVGEQAEGGVLDTRDLGDEERRHRAEMLAVHRQALPGRGQQPDLGAGGEKPPGEGGCGVEYVLAVVEDERRHVVADRLGDAGPWRDAPARSSSPNVAATISSTLAGSAEERSQNQTGAGPAADRRPTARAMEVLPTPPVPMRVTRRWLANRASTSSTSASRPTRLVREAGTEDAPQDPAGVATVGRSPAPAFGDGTAGDREATGGRSVVATPALVAAVTSPGTVPERMSPCSRRRPSEGSIPSSSTRRRRNSS